MRYPKIPKDTGSLLMTANVFGIALSTASKIIHEVVKLLQNIVVRSTYVYLERKK